MASKSKSKRDRATSLTPRDREIMQAIYKMRFLTVKQIARLWFNGNIKHTYQRLHRLRSKNATPRREYLQSECLIDNKETGSRKAAACYYLTDRGMAVLNVETTVKANSLINGAEQPFRSKVNEFFVEWYEKQWSYWMFLESREVKREKGMNPADNLIGAYQELSGRKGGTDPLSYQILYLIPKDTKQTKIAEIQREIARHAEFDYKRVIVVFEGEVEYKAFGDQLHNTSSLIKLPYKLAPKLIAQLGPRKKGLQELVNNILRINGLSPLKLENGPAMNFTNKIFRPAQGKETYFVEFLTNDLGIRDALQQYTQDVYRADGRPVVAWAYEEYREEYEKAFPAEVYPHIKIFYFPISQVLAALDNTENTEDKAG